MSCNLTSFCLLLVALVGACHAVFYTKSKEVDYPRIGRRSFYTSGRANNYPRIGRRDGMSDSQTSPLFSDDSLSPASFQSKRGFYTKSDRFRSYPRVGRSQGGDEDGLPEDEGSSADFLDDQRMQSTAESDSKSLRVPLEFLFLAYDNNGDGQLSKSEFVSGMTHYRQRNPLC